MAKQGYTAVMGATSGTLAASTAKSILGVQGNAAFGIDLRKIAVSFQGITATDNPVLIELCAATFATNPPGTNSTSATALQSYGRVTASGVTAGYNWTTEPTVLTVLKSYLLTPNGGLLIEEFAPDHGFDSAVSQGFVIRVTPGAAITASSVARATMEFERS